MSEFWIEAFDLGLAAMSTLAQLGCLFIVVRHIISRPSWRARLHWVALSGLVYIVTLAALSRLAVAAVLTALIVRTLIEMRDQHWALRAAAVRQSPEIHPTYPLLIKQVGDWLRKPVLNSIDITLLILLPILVVWEPHDRVLTPQIINMISAPARYVSTWWLAADVLMLAVATVLVETEKSIRDFCYAAAFAAVVFCALLLVSSRPGFSALAVFLLIVGLVHLSTLKFRRTATNLHAYDFIYFSRNYSAVAFWLKTERSYAFPLLLKTFSSAILLSIVGLSEPAAIDRRLVALLFLLAVAAFATARRFLVPWPHWGLHPQPMPIALFIETISEAFHGRGVLKTEAAPRLPEFANALVPKLECSRPTIILIMNESTFPPSLYRPEDNDPAFAAFFQSTDGRTHGLRVEIFGGLSWMTEFSVLTGIPASCYGSFGAHVFHWAANQIHHSLPQYLTKYGYRTGLIYPSFIAFVGSDRFYRSIGFDEIRDRRTFGVSNDRESDAFYLNRGLDWLSDHFAGEGGPAFLYVLTASNHYPHDVQLIEEGGSLRSTALPDSEFNEYLRRLRRTCRDYFDFRAELAKRFPDREFLIVHFGDHQPPFTARLRGGGVSRTAGAPPVQRHYVPKADGAQDDWADLIQSGNVLPREEIAYLTYFAVHGVNFRPIIESNLPELVESAYLSTLTLMAAGVPLDGLHAYRYKLMKHYDGRLFFADKNGKIAAQLNHQMMECGLINKH